MLFQVETQPCLDVVRQWSIEKEEEEAVVVVMEEGKWSGNGVEWSEVEWREEEEVKVWQERARARPSLTQRYQHRHKRSEIESHVAVESCIPRLRRLSQRRVITQTTE